MLSPLRIAKFEIRNRLFVGTGKYASYEIMQQALEASGCQVVTVAVRRERLIDKQGRSMLDFLDLTNTSFCPTRPGVSAPRMRSALRCWAAICWRSRRIPGPDWVKLEVLGDKKTLLPDPVGRSKRRENW